jgi:hypothetical protein
MGQTAKTYDKQQQQQQQQQQQHWSNDLQLI